MRVETHYSANYRKEIIGPLVDSIAKGSCKTIVGLRGVGLGPLVRFLHYHPAIKEKYLDNDESYCFLFLSVDELLNNDQKTFLKEFLRELKTHLIEREIQENYVKTEFLRGIETDDEQEIVLRIKSLLEVATNNKLKIIYLLQEFDEIAKSNSPLLNILYGLYFNYRPNLVFVYGVHRLPEELRNSQETRFDFTFFNFIVMKPFSFEEYMDHYRIHIKRTGLSITNEQMRVFYQYTGGLASYNRFFENNFDFKNLENLDQKLSDLLADPQLLVTTKQLLADLTTDELKTLKEINDGKKDVPKKYLKRLQDYGIVSGHEKIFCKTLKEHLNYFDKEESTGLVIDSYSKRIFFDGAEVSIYLSPIEYKFVQYLYDHKGAICEREEIIEYAWGGNPDGISDEAVDQLVSRLRSKLTAKTGQPDLIKTIRGRGFILE